MGTLDRIQLNYTKKMQDSIYFQRWLLKGLILNDENISENMNPDHQIMYLTMKRDSREDNLNLQNNKESKSIGEVTKDLSENEILEKMLKPWKKEKYHENFRTGNCLICQNKNFLSRVPPADKNLNPISYDNF